MINLKKTNFEVTEVKKPRKKYTCKPKQEQIITQDSDTSSSEDYVVEKYKNKSQIKENTSKIKNNTLQN